MNERLILRALAALIRLLIVNIKWSSNRLPGPSISEESRAIGVGEAVADTIEAELKR